MNILNVLLDDIGLECWSTFNRGSNYPNTPTVNLWSNNGLKFTRYYAQQLCSPTRATILSGLHPYGSGIGDLVRGQFQDTYSDARRGCLAKLLPTYLRLARDEHRTAAFGKWHLSTEFGGGRSGPNVAGFEHFSGQMDNFSSNDIPTPSSYYSYDKVVDGLGGAAGDPRFRETEYNAATVVRECIEWIKQRGREEWVIHLAPYNCHVPRTAADAPPAGTYNPAWAIDGGIQQFRACIESADFYLAKFALELPPSVWNNTLVIFSTDNGSGGGDYDDPSVLDPLTGNTQYPSGHGKDTPYDPGIHLPLIMYSAGSIVTAPGRTSTNIVQAVDILPTILDLLGVALPDGVTLHGKSLKAYVQNTSTAAVHSFVYSEHFLQNNATPTTRTENHWSAYDGTYTLVYNRSIANPTTTLDAANKFEFYNLTADPHQTNNRTPAGVLTGLTPTEKTARDALVNGQKALLAAG